MFLMLKKHKICQNCQKLTSSHSRHLGNMQIRVPETPNRNDKHSNVFAMVKKHEIDTKFVFIAHLVQKLQPKPFYMAAILDLAPMATPKVARSGALAKSLENGLGYIWAKFGAFKTD